MKNQASSDTQEEATPAKTAAPDADPIASPTERLLDGIRSPDDVRALREEDLPRLAQEVREELLGVLSRTGGHLGPNLGVVELTIALHRVFRTPEDRLLFDVSHQSYVHKLLTGRRDRFHTIRQPGGLNGFLCRAESEHDCYGAGHAGTALSAALGFAAARDRKEERGHVVAVAGDGALTCGISFEALNNVAGATRRLIVVLNDNKWSIVRNVGAIATYLNRITTSPTFAHLHDHAARFVEWIGGKSIKDFAHRIEEGVKNLVLPSVIFEEFGLRYYGPIDGHNIPLLIRTFEFLKTQEEPVLVHILTVKGKGYTPAVEHPDKFHGLGHFEPETGETIPSVTPTYSQLFGQTLDRFAEHNSRLIAITAAMPTGTGLQTFARRHPEQYFDVGIAEEHAAIFAAGLAAAGFKPFLAVYSTFLQRAFDMVVHDIALQNLEVALCMDRAGLSADDGPTHHGLFDIAFLRPIPNLVHMQPRDEDEFVDMLWTMLHHRGGPIAIRYPRGPGPGVTPKEHPRLLEIGKAEVLRHGRRVAIFALGPMIEIALQAADLLETAGIPAAVVNARWIKPLDTGTLEFFARGADALCTMEDHALAGGFGAAVIEHLADVGIRLPVVRVAWPDQFIEHGKVPGLREKYGFTPATVAARIRDALRGTTPHHAAEAAPGGSSAA